MHVITPTDLNKFQIEHYSEMLLKPRSFKHKIFLRNEIKRLQNEDSFNNNSNPVDPRFFYRADSEIFR